jgi:succinate dehydrogenase / fumarate reductase flavoprotein subunit
MSNVAGLFVGGEANFSDHGANRLGASALMQGLADGYFVLPATVPNYIASNQLRPLTADAPEFVAARQQSEQLIQKLLSIGGNRTPDSIHKELGNIMWEYCGMARNEEGLKKALDLIPKLREEFWANLKLVGTGEELNQSLEKAYRIADFLDLGELMCLDALHRRESCGGHFREESQTPDGEAMRDDENFAYAAAWEWTGEDQPKILHKDPLTFEYVHLAQRSYK